MNNNYKNYKYRIGCIYVIAVKHFFYKTRQILPLIVTIVET